MNPFPIYDGMLTGSNLVDLVQVMAAAEVITEMLISCLEHGMTFPIAKLIIVFFPPLLHNVPWPVGKGVI